MWRRRIEPVTRQYDCDIEGDIVKVTLAAGTKEELKNIGALRLADRTSGGQFYINLTNLYDARGKTEGRRRADVFVRNLANALKKGGFDDCQIDFRDESRNPVCYLNVIKLWKIKRSEMLNKMDTIYNRSISEYDQTHVQQGHRLD